MPASPGPIGRGSSGSGSPVPIPARADRLIRLFECRGGRGPLSSRLAAAPWQRLAALDRSLEFPGGTKRCSTRYSESRFSARRQLRIVSNSPSSASSPRRIAGKKRFLNSVVPVRWTTLSRAGTTKTARSASPRARQAPSGGPAPGPVTRHGYPCPRRGRSRKVRVVPWRVRSIHPAGKTGSPPIRPRSREARPNRARSRRHREPGGALLHPGRCRERYPARRKEVAPAGSRSRGVRGRRHANRSSGRRATPTLSRAPGLPAAEPMRPHRRVGAMRRDRALTRPTSCLPRIRPSASGACAVVGTAHRFSCFRADGRRIEPIPRGRPIDTDRGREAASCNRRHSDGRPRRRAGRDGGRVRLPRAARDPIPGAEDRRGGTGPRRQLPHARWRPVPVSGCRPGPFPGARPDRQPDAIATNDAAAARREIRRIFPRGGGNDLFERSFMYRTYHRPGPRATPTIDRASDGRGARKPRMPARPTPRSGIASDRRTETSGPPAAPKPAALVLERHRPDLFDPFVRGEAPDADMAAAQIAVRVPVDAARGALVVDLPAVRENAKRVGNTLAAHHAVLAI